MVVALSRFRVANGMESDVAAAFRQRPRAVEQAPGFLWLEVFVDANDPTIFYLVTRWTDVESFERWHASPEHRDSHALIPKGLKLDASWTQVSKLSRLDGVTGNRLTDAIADSTLLLSICASQASALWVVELSRDATIRSCGPAIAEQLDEGHELEGRALTDFMPAADGERLLALLQHPRRHESATWLNFAAPNCLPFTLECWIDVRPDGAVLVAQPTVDRDQRGQHELLAVTQELAVLSRERERLARAERAARETAESLNRDRNAFLTVLVHELRQPIGSALAAMGVSRKINPDPALDRPRAVVERQLTQLNRLVEDLADTARVAQGEIVLRRSELDLTRYLREWSSVWEAVAREQQKIFRWQAADEGPLVIAADVDRLQQVFSNLVGNAFKYTPAGSTISVSIRGVPGFAEVSIDDEGEGIAADRLPHIFELFQRGTTTGAGLGVGLAVVRSLVEAHGGSIGARSEGRGRGSSFLVRLPLASP